MKREQDVWQGKKDRIWSVKAVPWLRRLVAGLSLTRSWFSPKICNGQPGSGTGLPQSTLVMLSVSFYWCPILIHLSLMLYNLSKWQVSLNNAPKSNKWYIKLFKSVYKVAECTTIHVTLNIWTYGEFWYLATLRSQRYRILYLLLYIL